MIKRLIQSVLLGLLLCSTAEAQMANVRFFENNGGLNTKDSPILITEKESPDCQNVYFTTKGAIVKRQGYDRLNEVALTGTDNVTSFYQYIRDDGTEFAIATHSTSLNKMESLDGTWDAITGSLTITADKNWKWITWKDTLIGTDDADTPIKWTGTGNGTTLALPTDLQKARDVVVYRNFLMLFNVTIAVTDHPSRFYFSNLNTLNTWSALDFIDVTPSDGDEIVGAIVLGEDLYIFKRNTVYRVRVTGDSVSPFSVRRTFSHVGAVSTYAIKNINNTIVFASNDGVYAFDGNRSIKISTDVDPTWLNINKAKLSEISMAHYKKLSHVWISYADGSATTNDKTLVWDYSNQAWTLYKGINAASTDTYIDGGVEKLFHGDYAGFVFQDDSGDSDDAVAIDAYWVSKWNDFGDPMINKEMRHSVIVADNSGDHNLQFGYSYDFQDDNLKIISIPLKDQGGIWDTAIWDADQWGSASFIVKRLDLRGQGRFWNVRFSNDLISENFTVYGYAVTIKRGSTF